GFGGGLAVVTGTVTLENTTFSGNTTTRSGGGIYNDTGEVTLNNVTLAENTADSSQLSLGKGGGFYTQNGSFTLSNSLIALNTDGSTDAPDCWGDPTSLGYNLLQDLTGCTFVAGTGDVTGQAPLLGSLADNGGPTLTYALLPGSPAIDTANPADPGVTPDACATLDQRGISRPADGNNDEVAQCDMGAFEAYDAPPVFYVFLPTIVR
ncbi:MAG TPA: choice-of-anchor Q domain-containing protein, partial [Anaerolineales bacterium]|nr:choice-of-anchor Q domain-containing protein [Anaerolineales bacterium]